MLIITLKIFFSEGNEVFSKLWNKRYKKTLNLNQFLGFVGKCLSWLIKISCTQFLWISLWIKRRKVGLMLAIVTELLNCMKFAQMNKVPLITMK